MTHMLAWIQPVGVWRNNWKSCLHWPPSLSLLSVFAISIFSETENEKCLKSCPTSGSSWKANSSPRWMRRDLWRLRFPVSDFANNQRRLQKYFLILLVELPTVTGGRRSRRTIACNLSLVPIIKLQNSKILATNSVPSSTFFDTGYETFSRYQILDEIAIASPSFASLLSNTGADTTTKNIKIPVSGIPSIGTSHSVTHILQ